MWDIEVDIACVGAGIGSVASAIVAVDMGATALVATPVGATADAPSSVAVQQRVGGFLRSWNRTDLDAPTAHYLSAHSEDLDPRARLDDAVPTVRAVQAMSAAGRVAPFVGANVRAWNAQCLASPYGLLHSSLSGWRTTSMRGSDGQAVEVHALGSVGTAALAAAGGLTDWVFGRAVQRGIDVREASPLDRIVFDDGRVVGVVLATPEGPLAVRVRHGVSIAGSAPTRTRDLPLVQAGGEDLQVCLVGQAASRFLRVELIDTVTAREPVRPMCTPAAVRLRAPLREPRSLRSGVGVCGKLR